MRTVLFATNLGSRRILFPISAWKDSSFISKDAILADTDHEVNERIVHDNNETLFMSTPSSSEGEVIWELSDSEVEGEVSNGSNDLVKQFVFGLTFFLSVFHTFYRLSERAMISLLSFLKSVFYYLGKIQSNQLLLDVALALPKSVYGLQKGFKYADDMTLFTVCPKCCRLYRVEDCVIRIGNRNESLKCVHVEFPNHPQRSYRSQCGAVLMKSIKVGGKPKLIPKKTYIYQIVVKALISVVKRPDFLTKCEHWRERKVGFTLGVLGDVYDGAL